MSVTVGTQLGSHEISALLGKGGMGEVWRARDTKLKREVAIKILPDEFSRDPDRVSRFQREAEVLASLNHPNIAAIYDVQEGEDRNFKQGVSGPGGSHKYLYVELESMRDFFRCAEDLKPGEDAKYARFFPAVEDLNGFEGEGRYTYRRYDQGSSTGGISSGGSCYPVAHGKEGQDDRESCRSCRADESRR